MPDDDPFPVTWTGRRAVVAFPGHVDVSNVGQLRDRLLSVISRGATVLVADMTGTVSFDHAAADALARACQRAEGSGTQLRLVVTAPVIRRVLSIEGLDRLVSIYPVLDAALAVERPGASLESAGQTLAGLTGASGVPAVTPAVLWQLLDSLGDGLVLVDEDGTIAVANQRCAEMFGYRREELTGLSVEELVPPDVRDAHQGYRTGYQHAPQNRPMGDRARLAAVRNDGATFPVEISLSPVPTATENYVLAVVRDATAARRPGDLGALARNAAADQPQQAKDLLDRVVHRLFQVGLSLQTAADLPGETVRQALGEALAQLDEVTHDIRDYAFSSDTGQRTESGPSGDTA
jgi:anti-anti-sigma factor